MMVTFVSQCEKNALPKTRRILDAFANRIGDNTWQTVITNDGLNAVKKLLRKTASKNTAVSCHWLRNRSRSELAWVVGNRSKFNLQGYVPVNTTQKTIMNTQWENDWHYLPLIKSLTALAALFHDWGKASQCFQAKLQPSKSKKIIGDPLRHEWVSTLLLSAFVNGEADALWLTRLANGEIDELALKVCAGKNTKKPMAELPSAASLIAWLVASHHKLPVLNKEEANQYKDESASTLPIMLKRITQEWGYQNQIDGEDYAKKLQSCFEFPNGLPSQSKQWVKQIKKWAAKLQDCLPMVEQALADGSWRIILHHARLSLMLGDHHYSSQAANINWHSELALYANTDRESGKLKQKLDEHLVGVAKSALNTAHLLPAFEDEPPRAFDIKTLKKKSLTKEYRWQDNAVEKIKAWKSALPEARKQQRYGFFALNIASTGSGKTLANAKVMRALSVDSESLRYILALGLRTLTLQTGDEYRDRIGLDNSELAVMIGSSAVMALHQKNKQTAEEKQQECNEQAGSQSLEDLLDDSEIYYECAIPEGGLTTVLTDERCRKFLYAPVLACTIDHIMAATETKRGGRYILPSLRLMSSDLVIDEIDDFNGKDLIAIGRLIHLAGMLGRKVMLSSATIPPDLAIGYFNVYQAGWQLFAKTRDVGSTIGCAWIDEFTTHINTISDSESLSSVTAYNQHHKFFVEKRVSHLNKEKPKRIAEIILCNREESTGTKEQPRIEQRYFADIQQAIITKHHQQCSVDPHTKKQVSFGVVRVANISPCISLTHYLAEADWPVDSDIRVMAYHSQQILLMRSEQEKHLDEVLKRKEPLAVFEHPIIRQHLTNSDAKNMIFILVATPVEEVGRDHDFDWAVIEPSSFRSIIQLAGRVLRHRNKALDAPNIALMQFNLKALTQAEDRPAYCRPGYESTKHLLATHDVAQLLPVEQLAKKVDALPRIQRNGVLNPANNLADLEHTCIAELLTAYAHKGPESMQGWLTECWWLTALPQLINPFREGSAELKLYLMPNDNEDWVFVEKDKLGKPQAAEAFYGIVKTDITPKEQQRLWLDRHYAELINELVQLQDMSARRAALKYGEISLPIYGDHAKSCGFVYSSQLGMCKKPKTG